MNESLFPSLFNVSLHFTSFLISVSFHEAAHALVAFILGDRTAYRQGRLTLFPWAHLDFFGTFFLLLFGFGWARPVPIAYNNFRFPRLFFVVAALAGPLTNVVLALFSASLIMKNVVSSTILVLFFQYMTRVNITLALLNMLPIPPLDGSQIVHMLLLERFPRLVGYMYRYGIFILLIFFLFPQAHSCFSSLILRIEQHLYFLASPL